MRFHKFFLISIDLDLDLDFRSLLNGCCGRGRGETDGFKMIVISMFVFAVGVTVALIITIASGKILK